MLLERIAITNEPLSDNIFIFSESSKFDTSPSIEILQKLSDYFEVSLNYLMTGQDNSATMLNKRDENDIAKRLENTLADLDADGALMFSAEPLDDMTRELLKASLENSIRIAKINAKQKFTPNKYRNNNE